MSEKQDYAWTLENNLLAIYIFSAEIFYDNIQQKFNPESNVIFRIRFAIHFKFTTASMS